MEYVSIFLNIIISHSKYNVKSILKSVVVKIEIDLNTFPFNDSSWNLKMAMLQTNSMSELTNYNIENATNCVINTRFCIAVLVTRKCWMLSIFPPKREKATT